MTRWLAFWILLAAAVYVVACAHVQPQRWPGQAALERLCREAGVCL